MKTFCVIPAFNEAEKVASVVNGVKLVADSVVVVDDGSADITAELAENHGAITLKHLINRGQGAALRTGTDYCLKNGAEIIVHFDADGQFLCEDIIKIVEPIKEGKADIVFGSRFLDPGKKCEMPFLKKRLIMPLARAVNKIFFKINLTDPQSGFRAMSAEAARKINWQQDRMAHCSEIMFMVKKNNLRVLEIPIKVIYHSFGQGFRGGFKILKDLFIAMLAKQ